MEVGRGTNVGSEVGYDVSSSVGACDGLKHFFVGLLVIIQSDGAGVGTLK